MVTLGDSPKNKPVTPSPVQVCWGLTCDVLEQKFHDSDIQGGLFVIMTDKSRVKSEGGQKVSVL